MIEPSNTQPDRHDFESEGREADHPEGPCAVCGQSYGHPAHRYPAHN